MIEFWKHCELKSGWLIKKKKSKKKNKRKEKKKFEKGEEKEEIAKGLGSFLAYPPWFSNHTPSIYFVCFGIA